MSGFQTRFDGTCNESIPPKSEIFHEINSSLQVCKINGDADIYADRIVTISYKKNLQRCGHAINSPIDSQNLQELSISLGKHGHHQCQYFSYLFLAYNVGSYLNTKCY